MGRRPFTFIAMTLLAVTACAPDVGEDAADDIGLEDVTERSAAPRQPEVDVELPPEPRAEAQPEPVDPFAIPDEITPDYVTRVLNELYRLRTETTLTARAELETGESLPTELFNEIRALHNEETGIRAAASLQTRIDEGFALMPHDYGQPRYEVNEVLEASSECIVLAGTFDITDSANVNFDGAHRRTDHYVVLTRAEKSRDPLARNTTPWMFALTAEDPNPDSAFYSQFCA